MVSRLRIHASRHGACGVHADDGQCRDCPMGKLCRYNLRIDRLTDAFLKRCQSVAVVDGSFRSDERGRSNSLDMISTYDRRPPAAPVRTYCTSAVPIGNRGNPMSRRAILISRSSHAVSTGVRDVTTVSVGVHGWASETRVFARGAAIGPQGSRSAYWCQFDNYMARALSKQLLGKPRAATCEVRDVWRLRVPIYGRCGAVDAIHERGSVGPTSSPAPRAPTFSRLSSS